ncbi:MAG: ribosome assembly cofactor RimP, partial [Bacteroidales bacterium]|nr:ribosome assembly cofactor RimP [Bacteroidales bacterium]
LNESLDRDVEDYSLEVSSPGLGGAFRVKQQYEKNLGRDIEVLYTDGMKVKGKLETVSDNGIILKVNGDNEEIGFEEIKTAKAIISFN